VTRNNAAFIGILIVGLVAPYLLPEYSNEIAVLWLMIVFASTWDVLGGQMGYNSLGNIFFFGAGMYTTAVLGTRFDWPFLATLPAAALIAAAMGVSLGSVVFRVKRVRGE
jgi:branched-chain amino acid transport system permease protein